MIVADNTGAICLHSGTPDADQSGMTEQLDAVSMRLELGVVLVTTLVLIYSVTYRTTRSRYVLLWCLSLLSIAAGTIAYLGDGTPLQWWANPLGSALYALGAWLIWRTSRTLDGRTRWPRWVVAIAPGFVAVSALADSPRTNSWAGAWALFPVVSVLIGLASWAMWSSRRNQAGTLRRATSATGYVVATYYMGRFVTFVVFGPDSIWFIDLFGTTMTTIVMTFLLVGATFSMTALSYEQQTADLRLRASSDDLTGLLNRATFVERAERLRRDAERRDVPCVLAMADLDHFKAINDTYGHEAGDRVLVGFANASRSVVRSMDLVGRLGGEEFAIMLAGATPEAARGVLAEISRQLHVVDAAAGMPSVTISFGVVDVRPHVPLATLLTEADSALYEAKAQGRDRVVVAAGEQA